MRSQWIDHCHPAAYAIYNAFNSSTKQVSSWITIRPFALSIIFSMRRGRDFQFYTDRALLEAFLINE